MLSRALPLLAGLVLGAAAAHAQEPGATRRGYVYAEKNCTECHAIEREEWSSPEPSAPAFQQLANTPGVTWIALTAWLQRSHETMPDFIISPSNREDVIAYILNLKKGAPKR
jgi:mono/diheme cytochrome c family protein